MRLLRTAIQGGIISGNEGKEGLGRKLEDEDRKALLVLVRRRRSELIVRVRRHRSRRNWGGSNALVFAE